MYNLRICFEMSMSFLFWQVTKEVEKRIEDLTHQVHREILARCVEQVKTLAPILICSMKIFIQIILQGNTHTSTDMTWNRRLEKQILCVLQIYDDDMITSAMTAKPLLFSILNAWNTCSNLVFKATFDLTDKKAFC